MSFSLTRHNKKFKKLSLKNQLNNNIPQPTKEGRNIYPTGCEDLGSRFDTRDGWVVCEGKRKGEGRMQGRIEERRAKDCSCALESVLYSEFGHTKNRICLGGVRESGCSSQI